MADRSSGVYPEGMAWRCNHCDFVCGDDGPDYCPNDGAPMMRTMAVLQLPADPSSREGD